VTRDLTLLDRLTTDTKSLLVEAEAVEGAQQSLIPTLQERLDLYSKELVAITAAKDAGPDELLAATLADWTWLANRRYLRNFAGQSRLTRDLGLLQELLLEQRRWRDLLAVATTRQSTGWKGELLA